MKGFPSQSTSFGKNVKSDDEETGSDISFDDDVDALLKGLDDIGAKATSKAQKSSKKSKSKSGVVSLNAF